MTRWSAGCSLLLPALTVLSICLLGGAGMTNRPVVGLLSQELPLEVKHLFPGKSSYIPAGYVKAVEAAGARVAPIFINRTQEYYKHIVTSVNGVVFPGGGTNFSDPDGYAEAGRAIMDIVLQLQDSGVSFPILGVCQGYELLMYLASNSSSEDDILEACDAKNIALPLHFLPGSLNSRLYKHASIEILEILKMLPVTSNHHRECVTQATLKAKGLDKSWRVLTTNLDKKGMEFISSSEHMQRPLVGVQFHPEKNMYEWNSTQANPHSRKAVLSNRHFYDWLVDESRLNNQSFASLKEEEDSLMYNYSPVYTGKDGGYSEQVYFF